jgi:hypothetical protein
MLLAIAACVRLHNVLVGAFHDGVEDDWSEQLEGLAREEAISVAARYKTHDELEELAAGGSITDWEATGDAQGAIPARAHLPRKQQEAARALLAERSRGKRSGAPVPLEHAEERQHTPAIVAAAGLRDEVAAALHGAGLRRQTTRVPERAERD